MYSFMTHHPQTLAFWHGRLPHWEVVDGYYFVTIHLRGAIPASGAARIRELSSSLATAKLNQQFTFQRKIFVEMDQWLDRTAHVKHLVNPDVAKTTIEAIHHREQLRIWNMLAYVLMPSHAHLYFKLDKGRLKKSLEDFKDWTGARAGKVVHLPTGRFWQREWFDHWARSPEEGEKIKRYIRNNPVKAGLVSNYRDWPYGSWNR
jgi:REP element-mobilizing transposase RayT